MKRNSAVVFSISLLSLLLFGFGQSAALSGISNVVDAASMEARFDRIAAKKHSMTRKVVKKKKSKKVGKRKRRMKGKLKLQDEEMCIYPWC